MMLVLFALVSVPLAGQETGIGRKHHPWGRCAPGAWKIVRVLTKSLDDRGEPGPSSTTETKTTLTDIGDAGVVLEVKVCVELGGKHFDSEPQTIRQGYHGEQTNEMLKPKDLGTGTLTIDEQKIACRIEKIETLNANTKTATTTYFSDTLAPYVLKRESVTTDLDGKTVLGETLVEVTALNMPCDVLGEIKSAAEVRTVYKHTNGTSITLAFVCGDVPGGIVSHTSKELDKSGRLVRMSVLKLVGYSFDPEEERTGLFGRKRPTRFRKTTSHLLPGASPPEG